MKIEKLFQVLVVGGALMGGQAISLADSQVTSTSSTKNTSQKEVAGGELLPIFCTSVAECPKDATGHPKVKEGFECCWGTSCEKLP